MSGSELLKLLEDQAPAAPEVRQPGYSPVGYVPKLPATAVRHSYWYDYIIDHMLANPGISQKDLARLCNKSEPTIKMLIQSDMFKNRYSTRRRDLNEMIADSISDATSAVALSALREVNKRLTENPAAIPIGQLTEIAHSTLDRLGYGQKPLASNNTQVNVSVSVPAQVLEDARNSMREVQARNMQNSVNSTIDITPNE